MREWRVRYDYGVERAEAEQFVAGSGCVREFLGKYTGDGYWHYARVLCMFFKWLRLRQGLTVSPEQFLDMLDQKKRLGDRAARSWGKNLVLSFSRDNPDFQKLCGGYRYLGYYTPVKLFCDYHELPLTSARGIFGKVAKRKTTEPPYTVDLARRVLAVLNQRDRTLCLTALQSGQSIGQILVNVGAMKSQIYADLDSGVKRLRLNFPERKGNGYPYFSFISVDAIQELNKWRAERTRIVKAVGFDPPNLWITKTGADYTEAKFLTVFREKLTRHKLYTGHLTVRSHMFRKIFEQEGSPPERNIARNYLSFMMGHIGTNGSGGLDSVGGVYDKRPFFDARTVENEYAKLEQWINIYSGRPAEGVTSMSPDAQRTFEFLDKVLEKYPDKAEKFERFLLDL